MSEEEFADYQQENYQQDGLDFAAEGETAEQMDGGVENDQPGGDHAPAGNATGDAGASAGGGVKDGLRTDDDERKIFVGGVHWETTVNDLKEYFSKFGKVVDATLKTDQNTGKSRGFGFVLFEESSTIDKVVAEKTHMLHGRQIDPKRAQARGAVKAEPVKKIFVGGISPEMPEADIREYFGQYGKIEEVELPFDKIKNQRRGFCFITFETEEMVDKAVVNAKQKVGEKEVDIRKATPKSQQDNFRGGRGGGMRGGMRGGYAGGYYPQGGYDYSGYYGGPGYAGYGYGGYGGGYDYSGYYGQGGDWSGYGGGYSGYPGYDYSYYGQGAAGGAGYKAKRGAPSGSASGYHPYSR